MSRARAEMIEETRARLLASARHAFAVQGFAKTSMDDFTARAGLTRGALYHHFGDKKGLLAAVVAQLDSEMDERLQQISARAENPWDGFCERCRAYLRMAQDPEIQRQGRCARHLLWRKIRLRHGAGRGAGQVR